MGYSNDLRVRVIQVVEGGAAARLPPANLLLEIRRRSAGPSAGERPVALKPKPTRAGAGLR